MKPRKRRQRLLNDCDKITKSGDAVSYDEMKDLINRARKIGKNCSDSSVGRTNNTHDQRKAVFVALAVALAFRRYFDSTSKIQRRNLDRLLELKDVKPNRAGSNRSLEIVRLCMPHAHRRQQSRYALAVEKAKNKRFRPKKFYRILRPRNAHESGDKRTIREGMGLTAFIRY